MVSIDAVVFVFSTVILEGDIYDLDKSLYEYE